MEKWIPIDKAPKDGTLLLLYCEYGDGMDGYVDIGSFRFDDNSTRFDINEKCWLDTSYDDYSCGYASRVLNPTHFMFLPNPPKKDRNV